MSTVLKRIAEERAAEKRVKHAQDVLIKSIHRQSQEYSAEQGKRARNLGKSDYEVSVIMQKAYGKMFEQLRKAAKKAGRL